MDMTSLNWTHLAITVAVQVGFLIYFLGGLKAQFEGIRTQLKVELDAMSARIDKLEADNEKQQLTYTRVDDRIRDLALVVAEMKPQLFDIRQRIDFWHLTQEQRLPKHHNPPETK
jgi:hypothetical protein